MRMEIDFELTGNDIKSIGQARFNDKYRATFNKASMICLILLIISFVYWLFSGNQWPVLSLCLFYYVILYVYIRKQNKYAKKYLDDNINHVKELSERCIKMLGREYWVRNNKKRLILSIIFWAGISSIPGILLIIFTHNRYNMGSVAIDISILSVTVIYVKKWLNAGNEFLDDLKKRIMWVLPKQH